MLLPSEEHTAKTMLIDPSTSAAALSPVAMRVLSLKEAYAEKTRAGLELWLGAWFKIGKPGQHFGDHAFAPPLTLRGCSG